MKLIFCFLVLVFSQLSFAADIARSCESKAARVLAAEALRKAGFTKRGTDVSVAKLRKKWCVFCRTTKLFLTSVSMTRNEFGTLDSDCEVKIVNPELAPNQKGRCVISSFSCGRPYRSISN